MLTLSISLYILLTLGIGFIAKRWVKNSGDYVMAGRQLPVMISATAFFATWFGAETVLGAPSEFTRHGLIGVIEDPFGASLCLFLVGMFFVKPLYRMNIISIGDFYKNRFGRKVEFLSSVFMVISFFGWTAAQLVAFGQIVNVLSGGEMSVLQGILTGTGVILVYTYSGGMWAIALTDLIQTIVIIAGLTVLAVQFLSEAGGITPVIEQTPEGFFNFFPENNFEAITAWMAAWITIGLGSIPSQDVFQRMMAAKSERASRNSAYLGGVMYLSIAFLPLLIGLCARITHPELMTGDTQQLLPVFVLNHSPVLIQILFFGALLSAIMSSASAGMLAPATVLGENIVKPMLSRFDDKKLLILIRGCVVFVALASTGLACMKSNIYELVGESSALSLVCLFVPLVAGLWIPHANKEGALLSMGLGLVTWLAFMFFDFIFPPILAGFAAGIIGMSTGILIWRKR